jgi:hypothetical protein
VLGKRCQAGLGNLMLRTGPASFCRSRTPHALRNSDLCWIPMLFAVQNTISLGHLHRFDYTYVKQGGRVRGRTMLVDAVFCQPVKIHHPHRCGDLQGSRTVKTMASAREPQSSWSRTELTVTGNCSSAWH